MDNGLSVGIFWMLKIIIGQMSLNLVANAMPGLNIIQHHGIWHLSSLWVNTNSA